MAGELYTWLRWAAWWYNKNVNAPIRPRQQVEEDLDLTERELAHITREEDRAILLQERALLEAELISA